jgi:hypothetical protein
MHPVSKSKPVLPGAVARIMVRDYNCSIFDSTKLKGFL